MFPFEFFPSAPPVIEPFKFPKNLQDGGRAQVTCAVSSGDMPIAFRQVHQIHIRILFFITLDARSIRNGKIFFYLFSWKKDGHQISPSLQVNNSIFF